MSTTLTIRNLEEPVKQMLRMRAASHGRSMEAEARDILTSALKPHTSPPPAVTSTHSACGSVRGMWAGRMTTDEIMTLTRSV